MATIAPAVSANAKGQQGSAMASWMGLVEGFINNPTFTFNSIHFENALGEPTVFVTSTVQNVLDFVGQGDGKTIAIHINPGVGTLPTDTIAEYIIQRTPNQAFGSDYGRVSFSTLGAAQGNLDGIFSEYGGTVIPQGFIIELGYESPATVFTTYEYLRCQMAPTSSEASQIGAIGFGIGTVVPFNQLCLNMTSIGAAGTRNSNAILWEAKANNGTERAIWWRQFINVTTTAGGSEFFWQRNLNGAGWTTYMTLTDSGALTIPAAMTVQNGAVGAPGLTFTSDGHTGIYLPAVGSVAFTANSTEIFRASSTGICQFSAAGSFSANGVVTTAMSFVGPTGANASIQEWLTIKNNAGTTRYIPCF